MNWTGMTRIAAGGILLALAGCGSNNNSTQPKVPGPWDFPASPKTAISLYADATTHAVGDSFDVKVVAYNLQSVFGASLQINYPSALLGIGQFYYNPTPFADPGSYFVLPVRNEAGANRVSTGFTFLRGSHRQISGSAVVMRLRCRAIAVGTARLKFDPTVLAVQDSTGNPIANFGTLEVDSLTVTIQ